MRSPSKPALIWLLALISLLAPCLWMTAGLGRQGDGEADRSQDVSRIRDASQIQELKRIGSSLARQEYLHDHMWLLDDAEVARRGAGRLRETLSKSRVPNVDAAENAADRHQDDHGGRYARGIGGVVALRRLGRDVLDLGSSGDFVWIVQYTNFLEGGVTQELWVSASTGEVLAVLPP